MLTIFRTHALFTALLIIILYAAWFIVPAIYIDIDPSKKALSDITNIIYQWKTQIVVFSVLVTLVTLLKWWREVGFKPMHTGGLKFLLPPLLFLLILFAIALVEDKGSTLFFGFTSLKQMFSFFLILLMLGFTEELLFRGILYHGLETKFGVLSTVLLSALIFGVFHYINLLVGAEFYATTYQVIHATSAGFMYATLRLRIGAIWPVMLFHSMWDIGLIMIGSLQHAASDRHAQALSSFSILYALILILPALLYGIFVYWRWTIWSHTQQERL